MDDSRHGFAFVETHTKIVVRNFIDDIATSYPQVIGLTSVQGAEAARVAYLRIDGQSQPLDQFASGNSFSNTYMVSVPPSRGVEVEFGIYRWVQLSDPLVYTSARFIRRLTVNVENELPTTARFSANNKVTELSSGSKETFLEFAEIEPQARAYELKIDFPGDPDGDVTKTRRPATKARSRQRAVKN